MASSNCPAKGRMWGSGQWAQSLEPPPNLMFPLFMSVDHLSGASPKWPFHFSTLSWPVSCYSCLPLPIFFHKHVGVKPLASEGWALENFAFHPYFPITSNSVTLKSFQLTYTNRPFTDYPQGAKTYTVPQWGIFSSQRGTFSGYGLTLQWAL